MNLRDYISQLRSSKLRAARRNAQGRWIAFKLRMTTLRKSAKRRIIQEKAKIRWPRLTTAGRSEMLAARTHLPVAVLCHNPPVFKTGIIFEEFLGIAPAFGERYGDVAAGFIIYPTWTIESRSAALAAVAAAHRERSETIICCLCATRSARPTW